MVFLKAVSIQAASAQPHTKSSMRVLSFCPCEVVMTSIFHFYSWGNWGLNEESQTHSSGFRHQSECRIEKYWPPTLQELVALRWGCVCGWERQRERERMRKLNTWNTEGLWTRPQFSGLSFSKDTEKFFCNLASVNWRNDDIDGNVKMRKK